MKTYEEKKRDYQNWYEYGFSSYKFKNIEEIKESVIEMIENDPTFNKENYDDIKLFIEELSEFIAKKINLLQCI